MRDDREGRMPFAFVALVILLVSSVGVGFLTTVSRDAMLSRGVMVENERLDTLVSAFGDEIKTVYESAAMEAIRRQTQKPMLKFAEDAEAQIDGEYRALLSAYLAGRFTQSSGRWTLRLPSAVLAIDDWDAAVSRDEKQTIEAVVVNGEPAAPRSQRLLDTETSGVVEPTQATPYFRVSGFMRVTATGDNGIAIRRLLTVDRLLRLPLPLLSGKFGELQAGALGSNGELARSVRYILATVGHWRVLQGFAVPEFPGAEQFERTETVRSILTTRDVEVAINLALLMEMARRYRTSDPAVVSEIWSTTGGDYAAARSEVADRQSESTEVNPVDRALRSILDRYLVNGTMDPSDVVSLYMALDAKKIPYDLVLGQAINSLYDQLLLRYLKHFNLANFPAHVTDAELRQVQFIDRDSDGFVDWLTGKIEDPIEYSHDLVATLIDEGQTAPPGPSPLDTPPDKDSSVQLHPEYLGYGGDPVYLLIHDPMVSVGTYTSTMFWLHSQAIGAAKCGVIYANYIWRVQTTSDDYQVFFRRQDIFASRNDGDWTAFFEDYYKDIVRFLHEGVRDVVAESAETLGGVIGSVIPDAGLEATQYLHLDAADTESVVEQLNRKMSAVLEAVRERLASDGLSDFDSVIDHFHATHKYFRDRVNEFLWDYYDSLVDKDTRINEAMHFGGLFPGEPAFWDNVVRDNAEVVETFIGITCGYGFDTSLTKEQFIKMVWAAFDMFSASLYQRVKDDVREGFEMVKEHEVAPGTGDIAEAFDWIHDNVDLDKMRSLILGEEFSGIHVDGLSDFGLLPKALELTGRVATNLVVLQDGSNSKLILPVNYTQAFRFWDGDYAAAVRDRQLFTEDAHLRLSPAYLEAQDRDLEVSCRPPDCQPPGGTVWVDWNRSRTGGNGALGDGDVFGNHYTYAVTMANEPFEALWNISVYGAVDVHSRMSRQDLLGPGGHGYTWMNKTLLLDFYVPVAVTSPWRLRDVNYVATTDSTSETLDFMTAVLGSLWKPIAEVWGELIDAATKTVEFLPTSAETVTRYGVKDAVRLNEMFYRVLSDVRPPLKDSGGSWAGSAGQVDGQFPSHDSLEFCAFAQCYSLAPSPSGGEPPVDDLLVVIETIPGGWGDDLLMRLEFGHVNGTLDAIARITLFPDSNRAADILVDPLMAGYAQFVQLNATFINETGGGIGLKLALPAAEPFYESSASLLDLVEPVFVPLGADFALLDARATLRYHRAAIDGGLRKEVIAGRLSKAVSDAWKEVAKTDYEWSWEQAAEYVRAFAVKILGEVLPSMGSHVEDLTLTLELDTDAFGTDLGWSVRLSFVIKGPDAAPSLRWLEASAYAFLQYMANGDNPAALPPAPVVVPANVEIRLEAPVSTAALPKPVEDLLTVSGACAEPSTQIAAVMSPNLPWLVMPFGKDTGSARAIFGVRVEGMPGCLLDGRYGVAEDTILDLWLLRGEAFEV